MAINLEEFIRHPGPTDDKYSRGVVGFVTGSEKYPGAALLGVTAAMRCGAGLVRYLGPKSVGNLVLQTRPEVVIQEGRADAWVVGSGIDAHEPGEQITRIQKLANTKTLMVVDAGALLLIDFKIAAATCVLTPHAGEMSALLKTFGRETTRAQVEAEPIETAKLATQLTGQLVVLKGSQTVVADSNRQYQFAPAPAELATAGSGDVLAGIIGALLAGNAKDINSERKDIFEVVKAAIEIQSRAAELASQNGGVVALDIADAIGQVLAPTNP